jgi:hypothetical protein
MARRIVTPVQRLFREIRRGSSDTHEAPFLSPEWDWAPVKPWPRFQDIALPSRDRLEVFLFLQIYYRGGVWEATKDLVHQLVEVNRERRCLHLTLGTSPGPNRREIAGVPWRRSANNAHALQCD